MNGKLRTRNLALDSYMSILVVAIVGGFAALFIVHVAIDVPFSSFALPQAYAIDSSV